MRELLLIAIKASIAAGEEIMDIYSDSFEVALKSDNSPLTIADKNANITINSYLKKTAIPIISEENKQTSYTIRKNWNTCWMVDPLDGTKEFIKKNNEFTVNIALINNNIPVLGVIYVPASKTLYFAIVEESKAYKCKLKTHKFTEAIFQNSLEITPKKEINNEINIVGSRSHKSKETDVFIKNLETQNKKVVIVSKGSSLKFCLVAEGHANIYPRFAPTMEWDTAAGHAICKAVGLTVKQVEKEIELTYNKENLLNPHFVVQ
ncbi:3'(2'),5'-bisphosphate nucleotidase CysQ [Pseudalgibacter alginicilyticus]|uniref:3'(2'),5'-bisphosphate nucleotidase CysQ n=1 Tax=Pseudalgibacter alginicilyticus TaxID=1736674 RepID=A0A0P0D3M2_9FLAO|nr:3'(2'),5'-bisphosphate nucleotidase CysQ [Pseudalgibacter alginicilyticus]ALJ04608.1 3'(2'),5'-bisphosphate nucleotidase CysQ [Pseudalgibacter alginicilyticus]